MYSVVQFIENQKFSVMAVPSSWVKKSCLFWPKLSNAKIEKLRIDGCDFEGPTKKIPVIVHKRFKELREAEESAETLSKREVSDVDDKKKRLKPAKKPKAVAPKDYNSLVEECTRKKPAPQVASGSNNKIAIQTSNAAVIDPKEPCLGAPIVPDRVNDTACTGKAQGSSYIPPDAPIPGSFLPVRALNESFNPATVLVARPYEQIQVASFVHETAVHDVNRAHESGVSTPNTVVNIQSTSVDMSYMQPNSRSDMHPNDNSFLFETTVGQEEPYSQVTTEYLPGSSKCLKGMSLREQSPMDTGRLIEEEVFYASPSDRNDASGLQIVGTMSYEQMKADLKIFIESTVEKSIETCFTRFAALTDMKRRDETDEPDKVEEHQLISNEEELGAWNIKLNSKELCRRYLEHFSKIIIPNAHNGKGDDACYTVVDCLFTRDFWTKMTWTGISRGNKAKKGFREHGNVTQLLRNIVQIGDPSYTAQKLELFCKNRLFRYSKSRAASQQLRKSACRPNRARKTTVKSAPSGGIQEDDVDMHSTDDSRVSEDSPNDDSSKETDSDGGVNDQSE